MLYLNMEGNKKYDDKITKHKDFNEIIKYRIMEMLRINIDAAMRDIYLDINSIFSILYRSSNPEDEDLINEIGDGIANLIKKCEDNGSTLHFIYHTDKSILHVDTYPDWCKERYERVDFTKTKFVLKILTIIKNMSMNVKSIKLVNTKNIHPAFYVWVKENGLSKAPKKPVIITKDSVFFGIPLNHLLYYNGLKLIDASFDYDFIKEYPNVGKRFSLYYIIIRGDKRNEYKGYPKYGEVASYKYIKEHIVPISLNGEHPLKEFFDKYKRLYLLEEGIKYLHSKEIFPFEIFK